MKAAPILAAATAAGALTACTVSDQTPGDQASPAGVRAGVLSCQLEEATNAVVYSTREFDCTFDPTAGRSVGYAGDVQSLGVDLSFTEDQTITWAVLAPSRDVDPGALAGSYYGAKADAALGVGAGARVLVGGSAEAITLQPLAVSTSEGFGAAAGITEFELSGPEA